MDGYLLEAKKEMSYCPTRLDEHRYEINLKGYGNIFFDWLIAKRYLNNSKIPC